MVGCLVHGVQLNLRVQSSDKNFSETKMWVNHGACQGCTGCKYLMRNSHLIHLISYESKGSIVMGNLFKI